MMMSLGHWQAWKNAEAARKKFPGAKRLSIRYGSNGEVRQITPHYETRGDFTSWKDQQVAMQQSLLTLRLREIDPGR